MVHPAARTMRVIFRRAPATWPGHPRRMTGRRVRITSHGSTAGCCRARRQGRDAIRPSGIGVRGPAAVAAAAPAGPAREAWVLRDACGVRYGARPGQTQSATALAPSAHRQAIAGVADDLAGAMTRESRAICA